jgi:cytochrome c oxidase subunit II
MLNYLGMPAAASAHAGEIDQMVAIVHWLMLVLFVGWGAFFLFVLFRFRRGANPNASYTGAKGKLSKGLEVAIAIVEVVLLVFYAIPAWARRVTNFPGGSDAVIVRVVGHQFAWEAQYAGADGKFGRTDPKLVAADNPLGLDRSDPAARDDITETNQLHIPVNRPVLVHLSSQDVIHSFGLYEMRVKQDAIPGLETPVWFIPTVTTNEMRSRTGKSDFDYEITCSQLCGLGHYRMRGYVVVQTEAEYNAWMADQIKALAPAPAAPAAPAATPAR